jgi:hypothetical protein
MSGDFFLFVRVCLCMVVWGALPVAGAWAGVCPNEALRSELGSGQLPDCRAYEIVSPPFTESAILTEVFAVSLDGSGVVVGSLGTFGGAEVGSLHNSIVTAQAYLLSRTQTGWTMPVSLGPASWRYPSGDMLDTSADLSASLWVMETLAQPGVFGLYLERPVGTFVKVGSLTPTGGGKGGRYLGASDDLSRVLFSTVPGSGSRWPFDGTVNAETLYEYIGVDQSSEEHPGKREPGLVGVEGGLGSRTLISDCGTRLGSSSREEGEREHGFGSVYNAISAGGERVFFTSIGADHNPCGLPQPPVDEVFVREAVPLPVEAGSPEMRTLPISCPSAPLSPCADANFEGASRDGSKVFFTSTGKLLEGASADSAGSNSAQACSATTEPGSGCNLYEYDFGNPAGHNLVDVSGGDTSGEGPRVQGVARISEDGSHVYFVAKGRLTEVPNGLGRKALAGADNLYVYAAGHVSFIATLSPVDASDWSREDERPVLASGEGRYLVFTSVADLTNEDINKGVGAGKPQVFQYDAQAGVLARASIGQGGYNDNGREPVAGSAVRNRFLTSYGYNATNSPTLASASSAAANGAVFFESPDALTPQALSDQQVAFDFGKLVPNVYEYRAGHVYLLSDGRDVSVVDQSPGVSLVGSDATGGDVFLFSSDSLIPRSGNTQQALYDARVEGGFPTPASPSGCAEACQGALAGAPALAPLGGSATQTAEVPATTFAPAPIKPKAKTKAKTKSRRPKPRRGRRVRAGMRASRVALPGHAHDSGSRSVR